MALEHAEKRREADIKKLRSEQIKREKADMERQIVK